MKCIACGREMLDRDTYYECSNVLCDYEEEIEHKDHMDKTKTRTANHYSYSNNAVRRSSLACQKKRG
jgi:hypothetical protein